MQSFKLTVAYDGTAYAGWQVQKDQPTIQDSIERALEELTGEPTRIIGSGRTDAGVHALRQVASFRAATDLSPEVMLRALNAKLPRDIAVLQVERAAADFHAIRDAAGKRYRYVIQDGPGRDVFLQRYAWRVPQMLDIESMQRACLHLRGRLDFASFEAAGSERATTVRTVNDISMIRGAGESATIVFEIAADGFLYNMVRNIVGSLVEVGRGKHPPDWISEVLQARNRSQAGPTAPPQGLFLVRVDYNR